MLYWCGDCLRAHKRKVDAMRELETLLGALPKLVDVVVVEGCRDVQAIQALGCTGVIEELNQTGINDYDLSDMLARKYSNILLLLDGDEEGLNLHKHFTQLLERKGVKVEYGLRREIARLMAAIGIYAVESLDNIRDDLYQ